MEINGTDIAEQVREARRLMERERERLQERIEAQDIYLKLLEQYESLQVENERLRNELDEQVAENDRLHQQLDDKDMKLNELGKFSVNMAKKSSQEGLEKAFRIYINTSKRKTQAKREVARAQLLDFIATAKLEMPEDIMELLNHLDDEQLPVEQPQGASGGVTENLAELLTAEAQVLWQRLRDAGFIVADGYALAEGVSANQAAYIADRMAERLQIKKKWKLFQQLWGIPNLAQLAGSWQQTGKLPPRSNDIDRIVK